MAFGAFAPMPLRLGGTVQEGWSPEQHARMAADVAAEYSTGSFAILSYTKAGATVTVTAYNGRNGVGITFAPTPTVNGAGNVTWDWPPTWTDDLGTIHTLAFSHADATVAKIDAVHFASPYAVGGLSVSVASGTDAPITLEVWSPEERRPAHYGGTPDKRPSATEGRTPYAWGWYRHYQASMGSAYTAERASMVHAENLADARRQAGKMRCAERLERNSVPTTADERLAYWATVMRIPFVAADVTEDIRAACAAKAQIASVENRIALDTTLATLLGGAFVQTVVTTGVDLDTPPDITHWPIINPGDPVASLGNGAWSSVRCHLFVEIRENTAPPAAPALPLLRLANGAMVELLDEALPSYATFSFARADHTNGFRCDHSLIDFDGML